VGFDVVALMLMGYEIFGLFSSADLFHIIPMTILFNFILDSMYSGTRRLRSVQMRSFSLLNRIFDATCL
jgi:hypothetical protein